MSSIVVCSKLIRSKSLNGRLKLDLRDGLRHKWAPLLQSSQTLYHSESKYFGFNPALIALKQSQSYEHNSDALKQRIENSNLHRYISAYREFGHLKGNINPLFLNDRQVPELDPSLYGVSFEDRMSVNGLIKTQEECLSLRELEDTLKNIYCSELTAEFMHLPSLEEREWFIDTLEMLSYETLTTEEKKIISNDLLKSQVWDKFLTVKFPSVKRYGNEGAESTIPFYRTLFQELSKEGVEELIFGMCHRGRLNILTGLLEVLPEKMFYKLKGKSEFPSNSIGSGDVLSHFTASVDLNVGGAKPLHVTMLPNPSHLEAQDPVVCGKARGRQRRLEDGHYSQSEGSRPGDKVACLQVHGDGALSGQGIVQETLQLAEVANFSIGGSVHMCINNQLSFTTPADKGRSSFYCTDVAKLCSYPAIHVNGDHPEAVVKAARLAAAYNRKFRRDVFVDICCWRRWGHNELDDPRFTNPGMYKIIDNKKSVPDSYVLSLIEDEVMTVAERDNIVASYAEHLAGKLALSESYQPERTNLLKHWSELRDPPHEIHVWDTGLDVSLLKYLGSKSVAVPPEFDVHPHIQKTHIAARLQKLSSGDKIDWATAESLAFASLLYQGYDVRLSGEDVGRGTFSQRHCMMVDQTTDEVYIPLNHMSEDQSHFLEVANSILSEEAVLGFEYGVSLDSPKILCIWESQFGDFFNGAQIILDTYLSSGEEKWLLQSGIVLILPHGYDGAGPEHSSCRMERFLQMCTSSETSPDSERVNWNVIFPTTSAQIFHALRRQMIRNYRKPLVVIGPKAILRLPAAFSSLDEMAKGTHFLPVIGDSEVNVDEVRKVVFVCGKHYYTLKAEREKRGIRDTAIVRLESLCPFPTDEVRKQLSLFKKAKSFIWSQEEHRNMGGWSFVSPRFRNLCGRELKYAGRNELGPPAVGIAASHHAEVENVIKQTFS